MKEATAPSVFDFTDYRQFLREFYSWKKGRNPRFSYRVLAQKVGYKSPGFFTQVLQGKSNLSHTMIHHFAEVIQLNSRELEFFEAMVFFNQARDQEEKERHLKKLMTFKKSRIALVETDRYEYYSHWYYTAIRELLAFYPFRGDYRKLGQMVHPQVTTLEAKRAVDVLLRLDFIRKNEDGSYTQTEKLITSGLGNRSPAVANYQMTTMELAKKAVNSLPPQKRNISTLTMSLDEEGYHQMVEKVNEMRRELLQLASARTLPDRVVQVNLQIFPMSRPEGEIR